MRATSLSMNGSALYPAAWYEKRGIECGVNISAETDKWLDWYQEGGKIGQNIHGYDDDSVIIQVEMNGNVIEASPLEIVSRIVTDQVTNSNIKSDEAIKALAVATATELKYAYANGEKTPAVTGRAPADSVREIVASVLDETVMYADEAAWTPVFYCSSGNTNDASEMVEGDFPYLVSVESKYDSRDKNSGYYKQTEYNSTMLRSRIEGLYDVTLSDDISNWIQILETTKEGYVTKVLIDGQTEADGYEFFVEALDLPSANVAVALNKSSIRFTIYGTGYGLGMSVAGAKYYASLDDMSYTEILEHYYPGTEIRETDWNDYYRVGQNG